MNEQEILDIGKHPLALLHNSKYDLGLTKMLNKWKLPLEAL